MFELLIVLIPVTILIFACVGFVVTIKAVIKAFSSDRPNSPAKRNLLDDMVAMAHLLNEFRGKDEIDDTQFELLRATLEKRNAERIELPKPYHSTSGNPTARPAVATTEPTKEIREDRVDEFELAPIARTKSAPSEQPLATSSLEPTDLVEVETVQSAVAPPPVAPAPWDAPDPPEPKSRRPLSDVLANFMQDKNIRWGELASGILIVGSAIGLVISLRQQLTETIPYFPALLFLLITAAIHAAGSYTLRKWKLRDTSRGVLVIGLFMIPLNFLSACLLSEERPLSDPVYWTAMLLGVTTFAAMTWWSSKLLFRRGYGPFVTSLLGLSTLILVVSRFELGHSIWLVVGLTAPVGLLFLWGTGLLTPVIRTHQFWTERSLNRMYLTTSIPLFAALAAISMIVVRSEDRAMAWMALTPVILFLSLISSWFGLLISKNRIASTTTNQQVAQRALVILGLMMAGIAWLTSVTLPSVFLLNGLLVALIGWSLSREYQVDWMRPIAAMGLAVACVVAINSGLGKIGWNGGESLSSLGNALFSSQSGLTLTGLSAALVGCFFLFSGSRQGKRFGHGNRSEVLCAAGIGVAGCALSLISGLVHRSSIFDTMNASLLLAIAAVVTLVMTVIQRRQPWWVHLAAVVSLGSLAFSALWNPTITLWMSSHDSGYLYNVMVIVGVFSFMFAITAAAASMQESAEAVTCNLARYSGLAAGVASCLGVCLSFRWPELGVGSALAGCLGWLGVAWSLRGPKSQFSEPPFVISTGLLMIAILVGFYDSIGVPRWNESAHWLVQCSVLGVWAVSWMAASRWVKQGSSRAGWLLGDHPYRGEQMLLSVVVAVCSCLLLAPLIELTGYQLTSLNLGFYDGQGELGFLIAAYASVFAAGLMSFWIKPSFHTASYLVLGWVFGWSLFSYGFIESVSVGSALRWLLSISCLITAGGVLILVRRTQSLTDSSWVSRRLTPVIERAQHREDSVARRDLLNQLVNQFLLIAGGSVLLISSLTVAGVMLNGADSLGGPQPGSWFASMPPEVSYGVPAVLLISSLLIFSIALGRQRLAILGSATYQYAVGFMLILLCLSPHPTLATGWFLNILQSVSVGMSLYGFAWLIFRNKIDPADRGGRVGWWSDQLKLHTLINGLLVTSFAILIIGQVSFWPDQLGGWVNVAGSPMGLLALFLVVGLTYLVVRNRQSARCSDRLNGRLIAWGGLVFSAMLAALLDTHTASVFIGIRTLIVGSLITSTVLTVYEILQYRRSPNASRLIEVWALVLATSLVISLAWRAGQFDPLNVWAYVAAASLMVILVTALGVYSDRFRLQYLATLYGLVPVAILVPLNVLDSVLTTINVGMITVLCIGCAWSIAFILKPERRQRPWIEFLLNNGLLIAACIWTVLLSIWQLVEDTARVGSNPWLFQPAGIGFLVVSLAYLVLTTWNRGLRLFLVSRYVWFLGVTVTLVSCFVRIGGASNGMRFLWISFAVAVLNLGWGVVWATRTRWFAPAERWGIPKLVARQQELRYQLPIYALMSGSLVFLISLLAIGNESHRALRYLAAMTPFLVAIGVGALSDARKRRWMQLLALLMLTVSLVLVGLADLPVNAKGVQWLVRVMLVLAATMFIYGALVSRWSQAEDSWLQSLRDMASVTCALALPCLVFLVTWEFEDFNNQIAGSSVPMVDSVGVAVAVLGMIVGLVTIAMRPKMDPFSMSVRGRTIYVYVAQGVSALLCLHLYFTMPWLFQFGLAQFWPYLMIAIAFGGVGASHLLQLRQLEVLAQPMFNTAATLPVLVSIGVFLASDTQTNTSLVLLAAGLLYLMLSYRQKSVLSGAIAIVLGNLALWVFYDKFPNYSFFEHPQLWLIPPAISILVAGQLLRDQLSRGHLATLRYVCLATIYISSTSGIFINGIGEQVWPPIILALLSIIGILAGIGFRIRAFLYLGTLFLVLSMVAMVYQAQRALDHTWPWWVFGICMGTAILIMFGLFEKRRNQMKQIASQLQEWDL
ncbi:MAG: hypothetical protein MK106_00935 [Mariniblastus sp.]|nr:hypothetical protein [Mariniblastus sp.]